MGFCDRDFLLSIPDLELAESEGFQPWPLLFQWEIFMDIYVKYTYVELKPAQTKRWLIPDAYQISQIPCSEYKFTTNSKQIQW